jgi:uncharacterized protein
MASNFDSEKYLNVDWKTAKEEKSTHYERLGLVPGRPYTPAQVEEAFDHRYNWWNDRKKQKDSGRNSELIQKVGDYIETAFENLRLAKDCLSDAEKKCVYDNEILAKLAQEKEGPFLNNVAGALLDHELSQSEKAGLFERARELGITRERAQVLIWEKLKETGSREVDEPTSTGSGGKVDGGQRKPESDPPELTINQTNFPLGTLRKGEKREAIFTIDNRGGGTLQGHFTTSHPHWLQVSPSAIIERRHHQEVKVTVDTSKLALGSSYTGEVKVHSNGGTQPITVQFSIEIEKAALARFRQGLFWLGFFGGGLLGYLFYQFLPAGPSRDATAGLAGLVGIVAAMVVGGRSASFGGGCAGLLLASAILGTLQKVWPEGFSTLSWAITYGTLLHTASRPLFVARQAKKAGPMLAVAAGAIFLVLGVIISGRYINDQAGQRPQPAVSGNVKPSFDCAKAKTPTEKLICRDPDLATLEQAMVATYNQALAKLPREQQAVLRREHTAWFRDYWRTCNASSTDAARKDCIASHLSSHTQQLEERLRKLGTDNILTGQAGPSSTSSTVDAPAISTTAQLSLPQVQPGSIPNDIAQFLQTWRDTFRAGNFDAHMECYAPMVETYYRKSDLSKSEVRREREGMVEQYGAVHLFDISNVELVASGPGRVVVKFRTHWELSGKGYFAGEDVEKLTLLQIDGRWAITDEEEPLVYWVKKGGNDRSAMTPQAPTERDLPFFMSRLVTEQDLEGKSAWELDVMRNEIFARHGRQFVRENLQRYFSAQSWYVPRFTATQFPIFSLSSLQQKNVALILSYQKAHGMGIQ